jgi:hypothetical protein
MWRIVSVPPEESQQRLVEFFFRSDPAGKQFTSDSIRASSTGFGVSGAR